MAIIRVPLEVSDDLLAQCAAGEVDIMGLAKNAENGQIVKHLDVANEIDDAKDSAGEDIAVGAIIAVAITAIAGLTALIINKINAKKIAEFKDSLISYIKAVEDQSFTKDHIDRLITAMDKLNRRARKRLSISFSTSELNALIECLCNHTKNLAIANEVTIDETYTDEEKSDILLRLRKTLEQQKQIFEKAA